MTIKEVIDYVDGVKPNAFSTAVKVKWLEQLDGHIAAEELCMNPVDLKKLRYSVDDLDTELLVEPPYDDIYVFWLEAKIDFANGEYNKYQNTMQSYNEHYGSFVVWFAEHFEREWKGGPNRKDWKGFYFLSAYSVAVKHGFVGTEKEWLATLHGEPGKAFAYEDFTEEQLAALRGPAGVSPTVEVKKENGVATITISTAAGDTIFKIQDGGNGVGVESIKLKSSDAAGNTYTVTMTDGTLYEITAPAGPKGDPFTYADFTPEQLAELKGEQGDAFTYADFTPEQLESLRGQPGKPCLIDPETLHFLVYNPETGQYEDSGASATELLDSNSGERVRMWFGTVEEYNALPKIEDDVYYNILEGQVAT